MAESAHEDLIQREDVEITLRADKGADCQLESYKVKDFTNPGDNYACVVSSVEVQYSKNGRKFDTSYVVKLNPRRGGLPPDMMAAVFKREIGFYDTILPLLDQELKRNNESRLRVARYYHSVPTPGNEVIFMEDLRRSGFKMHSRFQGADKAHTLLIIKELARMHSASHLLISRDEFKGNRVEQFVKKFPFAQDLMTELDLPKIEVMFSYSIDNAASLIETRKGYDFVSKYLTENKGSYLEQMLNIAKPAEPFIALCHGDCWNNNFLFKYGNDGTPIDCRLVDLQGYRYCSPALDLNHFLYTSLDGDVRKPNLQTFLDTYYSTFASVLSGTQSVIPFTTSQLKKEFIAKQPFGLLMACVVVPTVLLKPENAPKIEDFLSDNPEAAMAEHGRIVREKMRDSTQLKPRLLMALDEFKSYGLFNSSNVSSMIARFSPEDSS